MKKRFMSLSLAVWLILSCALLPVSAMENDIEYDYLLSIGVPETYLDGLDDQDVEGLFNRVSGKGYVFHSIETVVLEEESPLSGARGSISPSMMEFSMLIFTLSDPDEMPERIYEVYIDITYEWLTGFPLVNLQDAITVNWDSSDFVFSSGSFRSYDEAKRYLVNWEIYNSLSVPDIVQQGGLGYTIPLWIIDATSGNINAFKGGCYFSLLPRSPMYAGINYISGVEAQYAHSLIGLGLGVGSGADGVSVSISSATIYDYTTASGEVYYDR